MTIEEVKKTIFNQELVFFQSLIPICLLSEVIWTFILIPQKLYNHKIFEQFIIILFFVILLYPFISLTWCVVNFYYCRKLKNVNKLTISSLISSLTSSISAIFCIAMFYGWANLGI